MADVVRDFFDELALAAEQQPPEKRDEILRRGAELAARASRVQGEKRGVIRGLRRAARRCRKLARYDWALTPQGTFGLTDKEQDGALRCARELEREARKLEKGKGGDRD